MTTSTSAPGGEDMPTVTTHQTPQISSPVVGIDAVSTLVHSFSSMITAMEGRLSEQIRNNASEAKERYSKWEREFEKYQERNDQRISKLEELVVAHLDKEHDDDLIVQARVKPVVTVAQYTVRNWKTIALILALITTGFLAWTESIEHFITGQ